MFRISHKGIEYTNPFRTLSTPITGPSIKPATTGPISLILVIAHILLQVRVLFIRTCRIWNRSEDYNDDTMVSECEFLAHDLFEVVSIRDEVCEHRHDQPYFLD